MIHGTGAWFKSWVFQVTAEALRANVVQYGCRNRAQILWHFGVRSKPAHRQGRTAVRRCMLIDSQSRLEGKTGVQCHKRGANSNNMLHRPKPAQLSIL